LADFGTLLFFVLLFIFILSFLFVLRCNHLTFLDYQDSCQRLRNVRTGGI
jgi:hypothetical protein